MHSPRVWPLSNADHVSTRSLDSKILRNRGEIHNTKFDVCVTYQCWSHRSTSLSKAVKIIDEVEIHLGHCW